MKNIFPLLAAVLFTGCTHTINFRSSHFASPLVEDQAGGGHVAAVGTAATKVTVVNNTGTNPPSVEPILINADVNTEDLFLINNVGLDGRITVWKGLELFFDNSLLGARVQILNHGATANNWVAAIHGAFGNREVSDTNNYGSSSDESKSKVDTKQAGISVGYRYEKVAPYFSYINESHNVSTTVKNNYGSFGPYESKGNHQYFSLGLTSVGSGFRYGIEYNKIIIDWEKAQHIENQDAIALKAGIAW
ncbi:hypothetical protein [Bdellovibrio sp. HCB209]|uniref:hypothetical protein n=1 Tax=Bdellovibrio sp. HCB209 TaxID=3394354 RepID=UPI0039B3E90B